MVLFRNSIFDGSEELLETNMRSNTFDIILLSLIIFGRLL